MSAGTNTKDWSDAGVGFSCVGLLPLDEAAQAVIYGKSVRLMTSNMTVTNAATPDSASGPQEHGNMA